MVNLLGAYLVSIFLLGIILKRPSLKKVEAAFASAPSWNHWLITGILALCTLQEASQPTGIFDGFWPISTTNFVLSTLNFWIHEAGHVYWSWGGNVLHSFGGTLNEIVFPLAPAFYCYKKHYFRLAPLFLYWFGHNCFGISRYVADARAMAIPLVGGGTHDWNIILSSFGMLEWDASLGRMLFALGVLSCTLSLGYYALATRKRRTDSFTQNNIFDTASNQERNDLDQ